MQTGGTQTKTFVTFGQWIKRLRAAQDLTQEHLAEDVACAVQTIRAFENGARRPSLEMAERLADILQVPAAERSYFLKLARQPASTAASTAVDGPAPGAALACDAVAILSEFVPGCMGNPLHL